VSRRSPVRSGRTAPAVTASILAFAVMAGCAARGPRSMADRFVVRDDATEVGQPEAELPLAADDGAVEGAVSATVPTAPASIPDETEPAVMLEAHDAWLAAALAGLRAEPTALAHEQVALEYWRLGVYDLAEQHLSRAIEMAPDTASAWDARARVWRDWGLPGYGVSDASRALYLEPDSPAAHNTLGTLLFALGQTAEAEARFELALTLDPSAAYIHNNLCYVALVRGAVDRARTHCHDALEADPGLPAAKNNLALIGASEGRLDEARHDFDRVGRPDATYFNMGLVLLSRGDYAAAAEEFDRALALSPELAAADAYRRLARRRLADAGGR